MEVKVYFNKKFPMSLINPEVDITKDLDYVGSIEVDDAFIFATELREALRYVFFKCQLDDDNLEIKLPRSLSVGDVLSYTDESTKFFMVDNFGFKLL